MKSFKQYITEEWVEQIGRNQDVFKNPTSKEWDEYTKQLLDEYDVAGFEYKSDIYVFTGLHTTIASAINIPIEKTFSFRAGIGPNKKLHSFGPTGGISMGRIKDKILAEEIIKAISSVVTSKNINKFVNSKDAFYQVYTEFRIAGHDPDWIESKIIKYAGKKYA